MRSQYQMLHVLAEQFLKYNTHGLSSNKTVKATTTKTCRLTMELLGEKKKYTSVDTTTTFLEIPKIEKDS